MSAQGSSSTNIAPSLYPPVDPSSNAANQDRIPSNAGQTQDTSTGQGPQATSTAPGPQASSTGPGPRVTSTTSRPQVSSTAPRPQASSSAPRFSGYRDNNQQSDDSEDLGIPVRFPRHPHQSDHSTHSTKSMTHFLNRETAIPRYQDPISRGVKIKPMDTELFDLLWVN
ncbi:hypothetical protein PTTG_10198 [Puccinia triticina 1-1 BBBD Race 1]|uniref:Uncharacterized protein n=1 Tax=Puccinia triticina (isolate 1-1 / race 1 (BBBD)) TaxID=630390 RepID=A0A0C4FAF7_PUCT1|nr:hypothetical protein PTTG_10198 [Puccinia triticina 1-1 BBBD Race 1]